MNYFDKIIFLFKKSVGETRIIGNFSWIGLVAVLWMVSFADPAPVCWERRELLPVLTPRGLQPAFSHQSCLQSHCMISSWGGQFGWQFL